LLLFQQHETGTMLQAIIFNRHTW